MEAPFFFSNLLITVLIIAEFRKIFFNSFQSSHTPEDCIFRAENKEKGTETSLFRSIFGAFGAEGGI